MKPFASLLLVGTLLLGASVAHSAPAKSTKAPAKAKAAKLTAINVCPMTGEDSKGSKLAVTYKTYDVHFCCPGCDKEFAKLSASEKDKKIAEALKTEKAPKA